MILQTAVRTEIWRGKVNRGEEEVLKYNDEFMGGKKQNKTKKEIVSCLNGSARFILRLRNCAVDFMLVIALRQKRNTCQGYKGKPPAL